ncbi:hypothetical protein BCON_0049g00080 [Botryotinia convoluta]|uniref:Uncharacterized protein n=1 Tax=Botryotinia convoluta TaxID=54673 RepID=A0A4Z1ICD8_9HELO|nr:hypothetical protein BCON_0049g00080 [Botryotinia convoluta]
MAPSDETFVREVPAPTKDAEVEKADEQKHAEEEDVPTLRSPSLDDIGDKNVNQGVNQEINQELNQEVNQKVKKRRAYTKWSKKEEKIVRDIIDNHKANPETSKMDLKELDRYSVTKLAEAGFVRTEVGVTGFRGRKHCKVDYSKVCDLVANMPESIRAMEARANYKKVAANASEPVRRRSAVASQSATSSQEWDTLSKIKNSQFALNGKRNYEVYNGGLAGDSTNAANAAAAAAQKPQVQACSMGTNSVFNPVTNVPFQGFLTTPGSKSCEVAKTQSKIGLNMPPASKRMCVTNNSKENPIEIRDDSPLGQPQSESDRIEQARASIAGLEKMTLSCIEIKMWCEKIAMEHEARRKEAAEWVAEFTKKTVEKVDEILRIQNLNPELRDYKPFQ